MIRTSDQLFKISCVEISTSERFFCYWLAIVSELSFLYFSWLCKHANVK